MSAQVELEVKRVTKLNGNGTIKAFCDIAIARAYLIKGVKVVHGKNGVFVSLPREQGKDGKWYETVVPLTKEARERMSEAVLEAFGAQEPALE